MPNDQENPENGEPAAESPLKSGPELYGAVKGTSATNLKNSVEKVDAITSEDEAALERGGKLALRGTRRRIARWALWAAFGIGITCIVALVMAVGYLTYAYIQEIIENKQAGQAVSAILGFFLGIFSTLAVEFLWHLSTSNRPDK